MDAFAASRGSLGTLFASLPSVAAAVIAFLLAASGPQGAQRVHFCVLTPNKMDGGAQCLSLLSHNLPDDLGKP